MKNQEYKEQNKAIYQKTYAKLTAPKTLRERILNMSEEQERSTRMFLASADTGNAEKKSAKAGKFIFSRKLSTVFIGVAALLVCAFLTYAAASHMWNRVDQGTFGTEPESEELLAELGFVDSDGGEMQGMTIDGVTIRPGTVVTDGEFLYLSFQIEGYEYDFDEHSYPKFATAPQVTVTDAEGNQWGLFVDAFKRTGGFFAGGRLEGPFGLNIISMTDGVPVTGDFTPAYRNEDGNLEYRLLFMLSDIIKENDVADFFNMQVHVEFHDLGAQNSLSDVVWDNPVYGEEEGFEQVKEGTWILDLQTPDREEAWEHFLIYEVNQKVKGTSWVIDTVIISPVSARMTYHLEETDANRYLKNVGNDLYLAGLRLDEGENEAFRNYNFREEGSKSLDRLGHEREIYMMLDRIVDPTRANGVMIEVTDATTYLLNQNLRTYEIYEFQNREQTVYDDTPILDAVSERDNDLALSEDMTGYGYNYDPALYEDMTGYGYDYDLALSEDMTGYGYDYDPALSEDMTGYGYNYDSTPYEDLYSN